MTKKDYQAIARAIWKTRVECESQGRTTAAESAMALHEVTQRIADTMAQDNPRFDRERFIEACETGKCKGMPR